MELKQLCELQGVSGREELVRAAVYDECVRTLGKENVTIDRMGNVIAHKRGRDADAPHVMVSAHMDEVGLMVISATDEGLLHVRPIGGIDPAGRDYILDTILTNFDPGASILLSTHLIADIERILDDVIFLRCGTVALYGNADEIRGEHGKSIDALFREVYRC